MAIDINLNNVQVKPIVVNADLTAVIDSYYNVVASAIFTDPAPTEGKGFIVFVRNGTATVGGVAYSTAGTIIRRIYHSGAWSNYTGTSVDVNSIGAAINGAASATPNDTDLVMSVDTSVAKKNTWTQIKAFLKTYFDTLYATVASLSGKEDTSNKSSSYTASSTTTYANTKALVDGLATKLDATAERLLFQGSFAGTSFLDSTTYYFSGLDGLAAQTTQGLAKFGFNQNRTITKVLLTCSQGSNYSNESVSFYLRENGTTDNPVVTTLDLNSVGSNTSRVFSYTVSIAVLSASVYEFKIVTPAFATNGTNSRWIIQLYGY